MKAISLFLISSILLSTFPSHAQQQSVTLGQCYRIASKNSHLLQQARYSVAAKKYLFDAEKRSVVPDLDLLAGYNYLSDPLEINLQTVKEGIVEGSALQSVETANEVFREITGNELSQLARDRIYSNTRQIINNVYPNYNPKLSEQQYFTAALAIRQPIYTGGKLNAVKQLAEINYSAGQTGEKLIQKELDNAITLVYLRIIYLNSIQQKQQVIVRSLGDNQQYAADLVKGELLPAYLKKWTDIVLLQANTRLSNLKLNKKNALIELNKLLGLELDSALTINDTLVYRPLAVVAIDRENWQSHPSLLLADDKIQLAQTALKATQSMLLPNVFGIGAYNLYQNDLPLTTPPWMLGIELQWNIFSGLKHQKRSQAGKMLLKEAAAEQKQVKETLNAHLQIVNNKLAALQGQIAVLDTARLQAHTTVNMLTERMKNGFSSLKDVNEALLLQEELQKAYYTSVLAYYIALTDYFSLIDSSKQMANHLQKN